MISMSSLSRRVSTEWRGPLLIGGHDDHVEAPLDFHAYAQRIGIAADILLTGPSRGAWQVSRHLLGRVVAQSGTAGGGVILDGTSQAGSFVFHLRDPDCRAALSLNGQGIAADEIAVLPPGKPFALVCREAHKWLSVSVPIVALEAAGVSQARLRALASRALLIPLRGPARQLAATIVDALDFARCPVSLSSQRFSGAEPALLRELAAAVSADRELDRPVRHGTSRSLDRINRDALAFIQRQDGLDSHVEDLCRAIDVAERSLLRAFRKFYGMGPAQYMRLRRLNRVHCALQARDGKETTVTGVMTTCGVTEFGRFAGAYRALFGESPSETLKRRLAHDHR
jgi:AraC-like DNA-binding protein